jgi:trehalose-6-phosphate synthase
MLGASLIGFHTDEYAENFVEFIQEHMPGHQTNRALMAVSKNDVTYASRDFRAAHKSFILRHDDVASRPPLSSNTQIVVHPLGIDIEFWNKMREQSEDILLADHLEKLLDKRFVLSVDRADYTKAVLDRMLIIDRYFETYPEMRGNLTFVQICGRTRSNLPAFDNYWLECNALASSVNDHWRMDGWKPIEWITEPLNSMQLSRVYAHADAMMVNPVRDGLNLTAKEYVACQAARPGVLLLSPGAGAWEELGDYAVPIILEDLNLSAKYVNESLNMPERERQLRMLSMKTSLVSNQLCDWWSEFSTIPATATAKSARHNESFRPAGLG